jgi:hypothetical protein
MNQTPMYPCNKGQKNNVLNRGYHHFQASEYGVVCIYCGERGPDREFKVTYSNQIEGQCTICGGFHALEPEAAHPTYYSTRRAD